EDDALDWNFGFENFLEVPTDRLAFAVGVGGEVHLTGALESRSQRLNVFALVVGHDVVGFEVAVGIDAEPSPFLLADLVRNFVSGFRQIADVAVARHHLVTAFQNAFDRSRLRRRLNDHQCLGHGYRNGVPPRFRSIFRNRLRRYGARCTTISERDTSTFCQIARIGPLRLGRPDPPVRARKDESRGPPSRVLNARRWCPHRSVPRVADTPEPGRFQELRQMTTLRLRPESGQNRTQAPQQYRPLSPQSLLRRATGRDHPDFVHSGYCPARPGRHAPAQERIARL